MSYTLTRTALKRLIGARVPAFSHMRSMAAAPLEQQQHQKQPFSRVHGGGLLEANKKTGAEAERVVVVGEGQSLQTEGERNVSESDVVITNISAVPPEQQDRVALIRRPCRNTMQSANRSAKSMLEKDRWELVFKKNEKWGDSWAEPLMGWTASSDPLQGGVQFEFMSLDAAIHYCKRNGFDYVVEKDTSGKVERPGKSYRDLLRRRGYQSPDEDPW